MYPNQQPPLYTTRHYIHESPGNYNQPSYPQASSQPPAYPYYAYNQQPTTVTYVNDRPNYGQASPSYVPTNVNRYPSSNTQVRSGSTSGGIEKTNMMSNESPFLDPARPYEQYNAPRTVTSITSAPKSGGPIEKTNKMSSENPFIDPSRPYEQHNTPRTVTSITSAPKSGGSVNKTLNLSDENPFHSTYGRYHYPSQIDASKRITTQHAAARSTENKSLNLSDENPFYSTYGRYHYPSQIDPSKRITEMPKAAGPLMPTNDTSDENPFSNYRPSTYREYTSGGAGANWNNNPAPQSYRPAQTQRPPQPPSSPPPPPPPPPARAQPPKPPSNAPLDKTSLNMSPDNPFASTYGHYHYPSPEEIKAQKRASERNNRFAEQTPVNNNTPNRPVQPNNQMSEYPETEKKEVLSGKGGGKFSRFDVGF